MKKAKPVLALIFTCALLLAAWPGISAVAVDSPFATPDTPNAAFTDSGGFVDSYRAGGKKVY